MRKHCLHIQKTQSSVSIQNVEYLKVNTYFGDMAGTSEHAVCKSRDSDDKSNSDEVKSDEVVNAQMNIIRLCSFGTADKNLATINDETTGCRYDYIFHYVLKITSCTIGVGRNYLKVFVLFCGKNKRYTPLKRDSTFLHY